MNEAVKKKISIGVEDFKELIDKDGYFVDKTLMIEKLIESRAKVTLFTRPRRFGKTLNQFMIRRFFEDEITEKGEKVDNAYLFDGLKITECGEEILSHQQQYPVIFLTLKSAKQPTYEMAYACLVDEICKEFERHNYCKAKCHSGTEKFLREYHLEKVPMKNMRRLLPSFRNAFSNTIKRRQSSSSMSTMYRWKTRISEAFMTR